MLCNLTFHHHFNINLGFGKQALGGVGLEYHHQQQFSNTSRRFQHNQSHNENLYTMSQYLERGLASNYHVSLRRLKRF